jgi:hypothetical protein
MHLTEPQEHAILHLGSSTAAPEIIPNHILNELISHGLIYWQDGGGDVAFTPAGQAIYDKLARVAGKTAG